MSTKIYNGYRVFADNLDEAISNLKFFKKEIKEALYNMALDNFFLSSISMLDTQVLNNLVFSEEVRKESNKKNKIDDNNSANYHTYMKILEEVSNKDNSEENNKSYEVYVMLYPTQLKDKKTGKNYYLFLYCGEKRFDLKSDVIFSDYAKNVEEYAYWNNTDAPEEVSKKQWETRRKDWHEVCLNLPYEQIEEEAIKVIISKQDKLLMLMHEDQDKIKKALADFQKTKATPEKRRQLHLNHLLEKEVYQKMTDPNQKEMDRYMATRSIIRKNEISEEILALKAEKEPLITLGVGEILYEELNMKIGDFVKEKTAAILNEYLHNSVPEKQTTSKKKKI